MTSDFGVGVEGAALRDALAQKVYDELGAVIERTDSWAVADAILNDPTLRRSIERGELCGTCNLYREPASTDEQRYAVPAPTEPVLCDGWLYEVGTHQLIDRSWVTLAQCPRCRRTQVIDVDAWNDAVTEDHDGNEMDTKTCSEWAQTGRAEGGYVLPAGMDADALRIIAAGILDASRHQETSRPCASCLQNASRMNAWADEIAARGIQGGHQ